MSEKKEYPYSREESQYCEDCQDTTPHLKECDGGWNSEDAEKWENGEEHGDGHSYHTRETCLECGNVWEQ